MKVKVLLSFIILVLLIHCKEEKPKKRITKIEKISAQNIYSFIGSASVKFQFFSDSSYIFTLTEKDSNYEKLEKYKGFCHLKNDTLYFTPFSFKYNQSEKAVIKNNFIEFVDGESPLKIEIRKNLFNTKAKLDLKNFNDYAFFTFNPKFQRPSNYGYKPKTIKTADLNQRELIKLDQITQRCFKENHSKLKDIKQYVKQCIAVINENQEKEVWLGCYCKNPYDKESYKYSLIVMNDGGQCNVSLKINLTQNHYSDLNISGR